MGVLLDIVIVLCIFILIGGCTIGLTMLITKLRTGDWFEYLESWEEE